MSGSTFGTLFRVTTFGESHGPALGAVIDGCPAGLPLSEEDIQVYLDRRKPGRSPYATARKEADLCRILSGVFEGKTTGTPIAVLIENTDQRSKDYSAISGIYRPGHADYGYDMKYGFRDYRGGGRSSARETAARVIAGAVAAKLLLLVGIRAEAYTESIGDVRIDPARFSIEERDKNALCMPDAEAAARAGEYLDRLIREQDSAGGVLALKVSGVPAGLGEPVFDKLDAELSKAIMSLGAVKSIAFGAGEDASRMKGSEDNDGFISVTGPGGEKRVEKRSNNAGGIMGGLSDGGEIFFRAAFKPTPSIAKPQRTVTRELENTEISIHGRHDPVVVPRAVVVAECMANIVLADMLLKNMTARTDFILKVYGRKD